MASVTASTDLTVGPDKTWQVLSDPARFSSWMVNHQGFIGDPPVRFGPGSSFSQRLVIMNMPAEVQWRVEGLEEPRRLVFTGAGPMGIAMTAAYLIEPRGTGSVVTAGLEFTGAAVATVADQLQRDATATLRANLARLADVVQG